MKLKEFLRKATKRERATVAEGCRTSVEYLYQLAGKHRCAKPHLAAQIEIHTRRVAKRSDRSLGAVPAATLVARPEYFRAGDSPTDSEPPRPEDGSQMDGSSDEDSMQ